jgi:serine/threonine protein kinase
MVRAQVASRLFGPGAAAVELGPYRVVRQIGQGGMGYVFEARDSRTGHRLALKVLRQRGSEGLRRLRREFRALADVHHHNLVQLYELSTDGEVAMLAMELVQGNSLFHYVRTQGVVDHQRLHVALVQLVDAISTLHAADVLHRDLKPENVLVQPDGRVVLLDFGLALGLGEDGSESASGTLRYMAPERLQGQPAGKASDWYSLGTMLREVLLDDSSCAERMLCEWLVEDDPSQRPTGAQLRALTGLPAAPRTLSPVRPLGSSGLLLGRDAELGQLHAAFERARGGRFVLVRLHGEAGMGKTALAKHFIEELSQEHALTILDGRCYEGDLVAFNAADGLIEALSRELQRVPESERPCPDGTPELLRLFPVLGAALGSLLPEGQVPVPGGPHQVRQRAFAALRSLLTTWTAFRPLLIHLDDLQWGDADSAQLLRELSRVPGPVLFVGSYRSAESERSACVRELDEFCAGPESESIELRLSPLASEAALALARAIAKTGASENDLAAISRESAGNPLFLRALAEHELGQSSAAEPTTRYPSFQALLLATVERLPQPSQALLQLVALAIRPIERELVLRAAASTAPDVAWPEHLATLLRTGLLRSVSGRPDALESYHDRVRETVASSIAPAVRRQQHAQLAAAEASKPEPDAEFLAYQYEGAGQMAQAARYAEQAGDRAYRGVALDNAAKLYALTLRCLAGQRPTSLLEKLANATAYTGRCAQAVPFYLEAAEQCKETRRALHLRVRAAEMLLRSGRLRESCELAKPILRAVGMRYPATPFSARVSMFVNLLWLRRKLGGIDRPRRAPSAVEQLRAEVCFSLGYRLGISDPALSGPVLSGWLLVRSVRLALESGTDAQLAWGLACYALLLSLSGRGSFQQQDELLDRALLLSRQADDPDAKGWVLFLRALILYSRGEFHQSLAWVGRAQAWIAGHCVDTGWMLQELDVGAGAQCLLTGQIAALARLSRPAIQRAQETGNEFMVKNLRLHYCFAWLAHDQLERVLREVTLVRSTWTPDEFHMPVAIGICIEVYALLYKGSSTAAWLLYRRYARSFIRAGYERIQPWTVILPLVRSTAALASDYELGTRKSLATVRADMARLRRQRVAWAEPARMLLEAGLSQLRGDRTRALQSYTRAADVFEALHLRGFAAAARVRQAELMPDSEASRVRAATDAWFQAEGVANPTRWVCIYAPVGADAAPRPL